MLKSPVKAAWSSAAWKIVKEAARHTLRRPVVGVCAVARTPDNQLVLIRRGDSGKWALPGGTLEWGETLRDGIRRELREEAGVQVLKLGKVAGVYSDPHRDPRFHALTVVVYADVSAPAETPLNPLEVREVRTFSDHELPEGFSHGMQDMLTNALAGTEVWE